MIFSRFHLLLLSLLSGLLFSISWPANGFPPLIFLAFVPLFMLEDARLKNGVHLRPWQVFFSVLPGFFLWNVLTTWWIWNATAFGAIMANVFNTLFMSAVFMFYHRTRMILFGPGKGHVLLFFFWISWEYFHMQWDLTWSWLNIGNVFASYPSWIQWYEVTGIFGGAVWIILINILLYQILMAVWQKKNKRGILRLSLILAAVFLIPLGASLVRYYTYAEPAETMEAVVVQPNIDPYNEQYELSPENVMDRIFRLAEVEISPNTGLLVCPESAIQEDVWENHIEYSPSFQYIQQYLRQYPATTMVIGASTFYRFGERDSIPYSARFQRSQQFWYDAYNTALITNTSGTYYTYHKSKLVVGVEKMPFPKYLSFLKDYALDLGGTIGTLGISSERSAFPILADSGRLGAIICYESVYGEFVSGFVKNGAQVLCIITNDGWWKETPGHRQHLRFATLRAIETRRSIIRSANTGISCFVNPRGDILQATPYWKRAVIKGNVSLSTTQTVYVKLGDLIARLALYALAVIVVLSLIQGFRRPGKNAHHPTHSVLS